MWRAPIPSLDLEPWEARRWCCGVTGCEPLTDRCKCWAAADATGAIGRHHLAALDITACPHTQETKTTGSGVDINPGPSY